MADTIQIEIQETVEAVAVDLSEGASGGSAATAFEDLTDAASANLPAINTPLAAALAGKAPSSGISPAAISGTAVVTTDPRLSDARTPTAHTHPASQISDSTATGRSILTAANQADARTTGLGSGATGDQLFQTLTPEAARVVLEINRTRVTQALDLASASTTFANTDLVLTLEGGVDYLIRGVFDMVSAASGTGFKLQLATSQNINALSANGASVGWVASTAGNSSVGLLTLQRSDFFGITALTTRRVQTELRLTLVATGTVRINFAQNALGAAPDSLFKAGSWLSSERL